MGSNCCRGHRGSVESVHHSVPTLADLEVPATRSTRGLDLKERTVEETRNDAGPSEQRPPSPPLEPSGQIPPSPPLEPSEQNPPSPTLEPSETEEVVDNVLPGSQEETSDTKASPTNLDQDGLSSYEASNILWSTGSFSDPLPNGFYSVIPVRRLKLSPSIPTLEEIHALGEERLTAGVIRVDVAKDKKLFRLKNFISTLVSGLDSKKATKKIAALVADVYKGKTQQSPANARQAYEIHGFPLLGQIRHGSCRARAIFFKALADTVGLESRLVLGFPSDLRSSASIDSYNHMSVVVVDDTVEMLVDLKDRPGQLIPFSPKAVYMAHNPVAWQAEFVDNNSCLSPLEPNSPMELPGPSSVLQSGLSRSRSEPNIATELFQRKVIKEQLTASSSCKSDGAIKTGTKRRRRRHLKTPEISGDISGDVLEMRQRSPFDVSSPYAPDDKNVSSFHLYSREQVFGERSTLDPRKTSLPSSPQNYQISSERSGPSHQDVSHIWNEVLESLKSQNKPLLPYEEWNIGFAEVKLGAPVGSGSFGVVFRGIWNKTKVAVKMLPEQQLTAENMEVFCNEISILSRLRHPNVLLFLGACTKPPQLSVVTEYMEKGSLYDVLGARKREIKWEIKLKLLRDICRCLMCIHRMGIVHRDLKSANCLLNNKGIVKICDFGLSRMMKDTTVEDTEAAGTPEWMAPELIRNEPVSEKCDIFSFGVIMWELCTLSKPWKGVPKEKVIHMVANEGARLKIPEGPLGKLIAGCWAEPDQRPSCEEIMHRLSYFEFSRG